MKGSTRGSRTVAEWITLAFSLIVVGGLVLIAVREELTRDRLEGARLSVEFDVDHIEVHDANFYVPYTVFNTGSEAILAAEIWFDIYESGQLVNNAEVRVQFLPLRGTQTGVFVTEYDPGTHDMYGRVESMQFP